jgi:hypothetical protein
VLQASLELKAQWEKYKRQNWQMLVTGPEVVGNFKSATP